MRMQEIQRGDIWSFWQDTMSMKQGTTRGPFMLTAVNFQAARHRVALPGEGEKSKEKNESSGLRW